jgi:lipoprotein-anchoring transpeptidase ErfK/SrfK
VRFALALPAAAIGAVAAAALVTGAGAGGSPNAAFPARTRGAALDAPPNLAPPAPSALNVPPPEPLDDEHAATWAPVARASRVQRRPSTASPTVGSVAAKTPEGTPNVVAVLDRQAVRGEVWVRIRFASLPNGRTGWVPRRALGGYTTVHTKLVIDRARRTATLRDDGRILLVVPVGVGADATPTPAGQFYVRNRLTSYASPFYGPVAFGTSARSAVLTDWPAGGFIGIHGTDRPDLLPGRVSHGCIRMRNSAIRRLDRLMPVGTPLTIR